MFLWSFSCQCFFIVFIFYSLCPVESQIEKMRIDRLKTLKENCNKIKYNVTSIEDFTNKKHEVSRRYIRFILFDQLHKVALNSVPKTGSTTWRFILLNNSMISGKPFMSHLSKGQALSQVHHVSTFGKSHTISAQRMQGKDAITALSTYYHILTVRHPFERLESTYINKVVYHNMYGMREKILAMRKIREPEIASLSQNGSNIRFEEFLHYISSHRESHWASIYSMTYPCTIPYRYVFQVAKYIHYRFSH